MLPVFLFIVVLWVVFGVLTNAVASHKGMGGCGWFALGCLLGPLGLLIIVMIPAGDVALRQKQLRQKSLRKCPHCAKMVNNQATECMFCGHALSPVLGGRSNSA